MSKFCVSIYIYPQSNTRSIPSLCGAATDSMLENCTISIYMYAQIVYTRRYCLYKNAVVPIHALIWCANPNIKHTHTHSKQPKWRTSEKKNHRNVFELQTQHYTQQTQRAQNHIYIYKSILFATALNETGSVRVNITKFANSQICASLLRAAPPPPPPWCSALGPGEH